MSYPLNKMPGWDKDSLGYHGDDGMLVLLSSYNPSVVLSVQFAISLFYFSMLISGYCLLMLITAI